jgi:hypothetical protein
VWLQQLVSLYLHYTSPERLRPYALKTASEDGGCCDALCLRCNDGVIESLCPDAHQQGQSAVVFAKPNTVMGTSAGLFQTTTTTTGRRTAPMQARMRLCAVDEEEVGEYGYGNGEEEEEAPLHPGLVRPGRHWWSQLPS